MAKHFLAGEPLFPFEVEEIQWAAGTKYANGFEVLDRGSYAYEVLRVLLGRAESVDHRNYRLARRSTPLAERRQAEHIRLQLMKELEAAVAKERKARGLE